MEEAGGCRHRSNLRPDTLRLLARFECVVIPGDVPGDVFWAFLLLILYQMAIVSHKNVKGSSKLARPSPLEWRGGAGRKPGASVYTRKRISLPLAPSPSPLARNDAARIYLGSYAVPNSTPLAMCSLSSGIMPSRPACSYAVSSPTPWIRDLQSPTTQLNMSHFL